VAAIVIQYRSWRLCARICRTWLPSHPVGALLAITLAVVLARDATPLIGSTETHDVTSRAEWVLVALIVGVVLFLSLSGGPEA
jgi:hypothetical protein